MSVLTIQFFSNSLRREVTMHAVVPVDQFGSGNQLSINENQSFKSLYLLHGFHGSSTDWLYNSPIRDLAGEHQLAVFMLNVENHFAVDDVEKGELYGQYFGEEVLNFTRAMFPLSTRREDTMIAGLSMGGYGALRTGLKYYQNFGTIIALSSALVTYRMQDEDNREGIVPDSYFPRVFGKQVAGSDNDLETLVLAIKQKNETVPKIISYCGDEDFLLDVNNRFHQFLTEQGVAHTYEITPGHHDWNYWRKHIELGLKTALAVQK